jgi:putative membrane protein
VPAQTPSTWWFLFISGAIAICAMILPGISGSFILLLLGQYQTVLGAINDRNLGVIAIVGAGATVGILSFTRILHWLLARFHDVTIAALIGFMAGSLRKIWPWKETLETAMVRDGQPIPIRQINVLPDALNVEVGMAVGLAAVGFAAVLLLESAARTRPDSG